MQLRQLGGHFRGHLGNEFGTSVHCHLGCNLKGQASFLVRLVFSLVATPVATKQMPGRSNLLRCVSVTMYHAKETILPIGLMSRANELRERRAHQYKNQSAFEWDSHIILIIVHHCMLKQRYLKLAFA